MKQATSQEINAAIDLLAKNGYQITKSPTVFEFDSAMSRWKVSGIDASCTFKVHVYVDGVLTRFYDFGVRHDGNELNIFFDRPYSGELTIN